MATLGLVSDVWKKINEFMKRISTLEDDSEETQREVAHLRKDLEILNKGLNHTDKIQGHLSITITGLEARVKELEKRNRGLAISAGKAKAKAARLEDQAKH